MVKFKLFDWHDIGGFLIVFALLWGLGWVGQVLAYFMFQVHPPEEQAQLSGEKAESNKGTSAEYIDTKWYWRLFLGYPPTNGKVAVRPAVLQILAILIAVLGLLLLPLIGSRGLKSLTSAFAAIYWILVLVIFIFFKRD
jgi:hypothetical protein